MSRLPMTRRERQEADLERRVDRIQRDERLQALRTRGARLALVAITAMLCIGILPAYVQGGGVVGSIVTALAGLGWWLLRISVRTVADLPDRFLDERQRTVRDRAYLDAYRIYAFAIGGLATIGLIAFTVASENDALDVTITWEQGIGLTLFLLVLASVLPSMVVAIRDPGEPTVNALR